jgi:hypothetical protein
MCGREDAELRGMSLTIVIRLNNTTTQRCVKRLLLQQLQA